MSVDLAHPSPEVEAYLTALRIHEAEVRAAEEAEVGQANQVYRERVERIRSNAMLGRVFSLLGFAVIGALIASSDQEAVIGFAMLAVPIWLGVCIALSVGAQAKIVALRPGGEGALLVANMVGLAALARRR